MPSDASPHVADGGFEQPFMPTLSVSIGVVTNVERRMRRPMDRGGNVGGMVTFAISDVERGKDATELPPVSWTEPAPVRHPS